MCSTYGKGVGKYMMVEAQCLMSKMNVYCCLGTVRGKPADLTSTVIVCKPTSLGNVKASSTLKLAPVIDK